MKTSESSRIFGASQADTLAVTVRGTGQVLGTLGEAYAARRYAQETNLAMKGVLNGGKQSCPRAHRTATPLQ